MSLWSTDCIMTFFIIPNWKLKTEGDAVYLRGLRPDKHTWFLCDWVFQDPFISTRAFLCLPRLLGDDGGSRLLKFRITSGCLFSVFVHFFRFL